MGKIRINKLALELNIQNDQILDALEEKGHTVKNYMSSIDEAIADEIRELFAPKPTTKKVSPKAKKKVTTKKTSQKVKKTTKEEPSKTKAPKVKTKAAKKTAKKSKTTVKKAKVAKTISKPSTKDQANKEPVKVAKKLGLKIVKHEEKPTETKKKPITTKDKPAISPKKLVKKEPEQKPPTELSEPEQLPTEVKEERFEVAQLPENIMIRDLAEKLSCSPNDIIKELMGLGVMTTINQSLSFEVASKVGDQQGFEVELIKEKSAIDF